jgi:hypothetical protein
MMASRFVFFFTTTSPPDDVVTVRPDDARDDMPLEDRRTVAPRAVELVERAAARGSAGAAAPTGTTVGYSPASIESTSE